MDSLHGASVNMVQSHQSKRTGTFKLLKGTQFPLYFGVIRI